MPLRSERSTTKIASRAYGLVSDHRVPKVLALTGVCIAVMATWQPWSAADTGDELSSTTPVKALVAGPDRSVVGEWDGPYCWPFGATHQAHLPPSGGSETGRVLMFPAQGTPDDSITAMLWNPQAGCFEDFAMMCVGGDNEGDPCTVDDQCDEGTCESECFTNVSNEDTNLFCAGHTAFADGTILTAGGHKQSIDGNDVGLADTNHFIRDPFTGEWGIWKNFAGGLPEMVEPRWYPTVTTLPDGRALVISGSDSRCDDGPKQGEQCREASANALDTCKVCVGGGADSDDGDPCTEDDDCDGTCDTDGACVSFIISTPEIYDPAVDPPGWTQLADVADQVDVPFYPLNFVLPDGTVLYAGAEGTGGGSPGISATKTYVLDLDADPVTWQQVPGSGDSSIPGGSAVMFTVPGDEGCPDEWRVLKSGGRGGFDGAAVYDWEAGTWTDVDSMNHKRGRHQLTLLPNGTVLATGGTRNAPAGRCGGGDDEGATCDPDNDDCEGTCVALGNRDNREYASFCLSGGRRGGECTIPGLPPDDPGDCPGTNNGEVGCPFDCDNGLCDGGPNNGESCWHDTDCGETKSCIGGGQLWVATAEIYDPVADTWTEMVEAKTPRMYHSSALLLPDGRVVSAGGGPRNFGGAINAYPTVEFFSPPYFFKERPEITSAPSTICYDETFGMTSPDALDVTRVTLLRLGTVTHSFDSDQRFQELTIASQGANLLNVVAPENANVAPPGYYMLFVITGDTEDEVGNGVPSVGEYVQVVECCIPTITIPGSLDLDDTCPGEESMATLHVCNTGCENLEVTSIISSDPQFSATEPSSGYPVVISPDFCFPFQVTFAPSGPGSQSTVLAVSSNDPTQPTVQVEATGTGTVPDIAAFTADNGYFGDVCLGDFEDLDLTIVNNGGCDLIISDISSDNPEFITPSKPPPDLTVGPGNSLVVFIRYQPVDLGASNATISISSNDPDTRVKTVAVSGDTPPGDITLTGSTDFGDVCAEELAEKVLDVCNVGACNLHVDSASIDCPDFTIINNPFPATVSPDFCMGLTIRFTPTSVGPKVCNLTITSDDPDTPEVVVVLTGNTPIPSIDVPADVAFAPTVLQEIDACETFEPFPVSNTGICNLEITALEIAENSDEYSLAGLPSFPIILQPGHQAGSGDLDTVFAPLILDRDRLGAVSVTYVSDPIMGTTMTENRALCGEGVRTGARVLVTHGGVPLAVVKMIKLRRVTGNNNQGPIDTVETAQDVELQQVTPLPPCPSFQYHREYGTVSNPIQLLPGSYLVTVKAQIPGSNGFQQQTVGFDVSSCDFNPNITVDF